MILAICFTSCKKKKDETPPPSNNTNTTTDSETQAASDNALAEYVFSDAVNIVDDGARREKGISKHFPSGYSQYGPCMSVTVDTLASPRTLLLDFGTTNCLCADGRWRRGKIACSFTGLYGNSLTVTTISFLNYYVNDYSVSGTITLTNDSTNIIRTIKVQNGKMVSPSSQQIQWSCDQTFTWINGSGTPLIRTDDQYEITGSASGVTINGTSFTALITSPVLLDLSCMYITKGTIDITPSGKPTRTLDFGTGACDNKATVTILGYTFDITLL